MLAGVAACDSPARARGCPPQPAGLSVRGPSATRFTMVIRVNKPENAETYASRDKAAGGLADRFRRRDVFLVNTRFPGSSPADWPRIVSILRSAFPCNRIAVLNGLGADPAAPGYAHLPAAGRLVHARGAPARSGRLPLLGLTGVDARTALAAHDLRTPAAGDRGLLRAPSAPLCSTDPARSGQRNRRRFGSPHASEARSPGSTAPPRRRCRSGARRPPSTRGTCSRRP